MRIGPKKNPEIERISFLANDVANADRLGTEEFSAHFINQANSAFHPSGVGE